MKKKIWIMNHYASDTFFDQGGRHYAFAKYMKQMGYKPVIFCANSKHNGGGHYFEDPALWHEHQAEQIGVPYVFVRARAYAGNGKQRVLNMIDFYRNVKKTAMEYVKLHEKPDVIYASSVHPLTLVAGIQLAKQFGVKCVCEVRDLWPESIVAYGLLKRESVVAKLLYAGEKWIYKKADHLITTWPGGYDYIQERGWDKEIPAEKVTHISNGVDLNVFFQNIKDFYYTDEDLARTDVVKAVYAGAIRKVNNLRILVDAAKILKQRSVEKVQILIWGEGDEKEALEQLVLKEGLDNVRFKGKVPKTQIPSILQQAEVSILHNSSTELDKYGQSQNKFFEYLAVGHPILMTYTVGHSVCRSKKCGIELEQQTAEAVADALEWFASMPAEQYREYCRCAAEAAKEFDFVNLTERVIAVIEE